MKKRVIDFSNKKRIEEILRVHNVHENTTLFNDLHALIFQATEGVRKFYKTYYETGRAATKKNTKFHLNAESIEVAKFLPTGEWVYGYLLNFTGDDGNMGCYIFEDHSSDFYSIPEMLIEVDYKTVGQYTGLEDQNQVEIYQGDIIVSRDDDYTITWKDEKGTEHLNSDCGTGYIDFYHGLWYVNDEIQNALFDINEYRNLEVVGNIHSNPDLLTQ